MKILLVHYTDKTLKLKKKKKLIKELETITKFYY